MTITLTITAITPDQPPSSASRVDFYLYESISTNLWIGRLPSIASSMPLATIQAQLDAIGPTLLADIQARNQLPVASATVAIQRQWVAAHLTWRATFLRALWTLDNGILTIPSQTLANYQVIFPPVATVLAVLPAPFLTHLTNERTAQGVAVAPTTLAQCVTLDNLLHIWLSARMAMANAARDIDWWINGG